MDVCHHHHDDIDYSGISHPNHPNFFILHGPGTGLGHNSVIFMIECQVNYKFDDDDDDDAAGVDDFDDNDDDNGDDKDDDGGDDNDDPPRTWHRSRP